MGGGLSPARGSLGMEIAGGARIVLGCEYVYNAERRRGYAFYAE